MGGDILPKTRFDSDEKYVIDLIKDILGLEYEWQKKFDTLRGDPGKKGHMKKLPVDAYFLQRNLIVEYREKQHSQSVNIMNRRMTISGVNRGDQRKIYDMRKELWAKENNINFLVINFSDLVHKKSGRLYRNKEKDREIISDFINRFEWR